MSNPEIKIDQDGEGNTQNNTFVFSPSVPPKPIPSNVPIGSPNFVGRQEELEEIHTELQKQDLIGKR